jgi:carbonic anhydrase/acetyltransferase-like protein (isoleucine patch superfamily)
VVFAGAVVQPGAAVGRHVILNTACSADHDNEIGDFAQLAPGAHLAGTVRVGEGAFIGTGATVLPDLVVGAWSTVGGGGVVARDVPPGVTVKGVPARGETTPADKPGVPWLRIPRHCVHYCTWQRLKVFGHSLPLFLQGLWATPGHNAPQRAGSAEREIR